MHTNNDTLFWKKKEFISFLLSILVFFIHSYFAQDCADNSFISVFNHKVSYFFSCSISQFAVPMFFMLSGITFFKNYSNEKYLNKIKNRLFTVVIPYLLWNTIWLLWEILCSYSFLSKFSTSEPYPLTFTSILRGIFFYGCNMPFWFIFDIIVFSFAAPVVFLFVRNKYIGILTVITLSIVSLLGIHMPENVFYYPMSAVFYLTGALIGYHFFDHISKKSSKPVQIASVVSLSVYVLAKNIVPQELHINNYFMQTITYSFAAFSLWNIVDIFIERMKPRAIYRRSFAVYAMHLNVAIVMLKVFSFCLPQSPWLEIPKFVMMVAFTLVIINCVCALGETFFPGIYGVLMGKRTNKQPLKAAG